MYFYILYLFKLFSVIYCNILRLNFDEVRKLFYFLEEDFRILCLIIFFAYLRNLFQSLKFYPMYSLLMQTFFKPFLMIFPLLFLRVSSRAMWIPPPHPLLKSILMVSCLRRKRKLALGL